jgi:DNA-binding beta-propeller fold protein YncE
VAFITRPFASVNAALRLVAVAVAIASCSPSDAMEEPGGGGLLLERIIPLNGVEGRIDHLAVDVAHGRLFVAELGNGSVEAIDLVQGRSLGRITNLDEPQGLAYLPASDQLLVASGGDGTVRAYAAASLKPGISLTVGSDADNLRVDALGRVIVGYGDGALATIDPRTMKIVRSVALVGHPESFRLDGDRAFINVPDAGQIVVADLASGHVTKTWKASHRWNYPMALESASGRLAVAYRMPSRLVILDAKSGRTLSNTSTCGDADDLFWDTPHSRIYVICGSGAIDVIETGLGGVRSVNRVPTRAGARTGLFVPELDRLFIAARAGAMGRDAAILVFRPQR